MLKSLKGRGSWVVLHGPRARMIRTQLLLKDGQCPLVGRPRPCKVCKGPRHFPGLLIEDELQQEFGVSRGTVRRALSELESMGLITRRPALGTFVTATMPRLPKGLGTISSFTQQLRDAGYQPQTTVLDAKLIQASHASERVLEAFDIGEDARVVQIRRLRLGNNEPFAIQSVCLLPEEFPGILEGMDLLSLFRVYERYGRTVVNSDEWLRARGASAYESEALGVESETIWFSSNASPMTGRKDVRRRRPWRKNVPDEHVLFYHHCREKARRLSVPLRVGGVQLDGCLEGSYR